MELQLEEEFKGTFFAITLSQDTPFYHGEGPEEKSSFQKELQQQLFPFGNLESGSTLGPVIMRKLFWLESHSQHIISKISHHLFEDDENLDKLQRQVFISLYYALLTLQISQDLAIDNINFTCKDGIDRGMVALAEFLLLCLIRLLSNPHLIVKMALFGIFFAKFFDRMFPYALKIYQKTCSKTAHFSNQSEFRKKSIALKEVDMPKAKELLTHSLLTRAYWVRKRTISEARFQRFLSDASWLLQRKNKVKALMQALFATITELE